MNEDLRRVGRVTVCCRAVVRDRYGVWTGVTENVSARGCLLVTGRLLRPGATVTVSLSSDLFADELDVVGEVMWCNLERMGVRFTAFPRPGALSVEAWIEKVVAFGAVAGSRSPGRVVPFVERQPGLRLAETSARNGRLVRSATPAPQDSHPVVRLPLQRA